MLQLWGRRTSSNVQAAMWCLSELNLPHVRHDIGHRFGGNDTPDFLAMNPNGTVPVLRDGDDPPIWETGAILRYLGAQYGDAPFWPTDAGARAQVDKWAEWAKINIAVGFTAPIFWRVVRTAPQDRDPVAIRTALDTLNRKLAIAEAQLQTSDFLTGADFTLADIQFGHLLFRYFDIDIPRADFPAMRAYYDRLCTRPAYRDHVQVSYDDLRVT
jgi:glutathione S-transferase